MGGRRVARSDTLPDISIHVITTDEEWDAIRDQWNELFRHSSGPASPLEFEWLRRWWGVFGDAYGSLGLRIVTAWDGTELVAALPLYLDGGARLGPVDPRTLRFISTGEADFEETCPEFMDLLCRHDAAASVVPAIWDAIRGIACDAIELVDLSAETPLLTHGPVPVSASSRGTSYVADITGGLAAYIERLSSSNRSHLRRLLRQGERAAARLEVAGPGDCNAAFDDLVRLHQERWNHDGKPGVFSAPRFVEFHRGLAHEWMAGDRAVVARLFVGDAVVAAHYGFITRTRFDLYQSGVQMLECDAVSSPGILAILLLMEWLAARGVTTFDFLRGPATHKERMSTSRPEMITLRGFRGTPRGLAARAVALAAGVRRRRRAAREAGPA